MQRRNHEEGKQERMTELKDREGWLPVHGVWETEEDSEKDKPRNTGSPAHRLLYSLSDVCENPRRGTRRWLVFYEQTSWFFERSMVGPIHKRGGVCMYRIPKKRHLLIPIIAYGY